MDQGIVSAASAMLAGQRWLDVATENLANANTAGYRREGVAFDDSFERELQLDGGGTASVGSGPVQKLQYTNFEAGSISHTGNPLDVAIGMPTAMFALKTPDGIRFTRDGEFSLDADRRLVSKQGYPVLDERDSEITLPDGNISVQPDGAIQVDDAETARLGVFDGVFRKSANGAFLSDNAKQVDLADLRPQSIEGSNVNPVQSMLEMITINRSFEMAQKTLVQQDELSEKLIQTVLSR